MFVFNIQELWKDIKYLFSVSGMLEKYIAPIERSVKLRESMGCTTKLLERSGVDQTRERLERENRKFKETIGELTME